MDRDNRTIIRPGILLPDGHTIYLTGAEWVLAFAIAGCQWAVDIVESGELQQRQNPLWVGDGI